MIDYLSISEIEILNHGLTILKGHWFIGFSSFTCLYHITADMPILLSREMKYVCLFESHIILWK